MCEREIVFSKSGDVILCWGDDGRETVVIDRTGKGLSFPNDVKEKSVSELPQAVLSDKLGIFTLILLSA